jgi:hypothetical protein
LVKAAMGVDEFAHAQPSDRERRAIDGEDVRDPMPRLRE